MSLIEKIDKLYNPYGNGKYYEGYKRALDRVKEIILSEQKEPCKYCENEILTVKMEFGYDSYMGNDGWVSSTRHPKVCPMCGRPLHKDVADTNVGKIIIIGDKIRESNESLADFIKSVTDKCIIGSCLMCPIYRACDNMDNKDDLVDYLNQPYME